jgi:uncharacterized protein YdaU (DUF1376 family)
MSELPYFRFMVGDWLSGKIQAMDMQTQGIYINILARAWKEGGMVKYDDTLAPLLRVGPQVLANAIQMLTKCQILVEPKPGYLSSKFILLDISSLRDLSRKRAEAGRKGGYAKHLSHAGKCQANAKQLPSKSESESESDIPPYIPPPEGEAQKPKAPKKRKAGFKSWSQSDFERSITEANEAGILPVGEIDNFREYWTEPNSSGTPRYQIQKTWDTKRRIRTWARNNYGGFAKPGTTRPAPGPQEPTDEQRYRAERRPIDESIDRARRAGDQARVNDLMSELDAVLHKWRKSGHVTERGTWQGRQGAI